MERPEFKDIKSYDEFTKYYWYLSELRAICRSLGIEYLGGKNELYRTIEAYYDGALIPHKPKKTVKRVAQDLTLDTGLIDCGFTFGRRFREFFIRATGDTKFKFTVDMVATVKAVRENNDRAFTLGDLLDVKLGKRVYAVHDRSSCQWNKFLRDFCADEANSVYPDRLNAARRFWELLKSSDLPKVYSRGFIDSNRDKI